MSDLYYYSISGEVSAEPVPREDVPSEAEYVVAEERAGDDPVPWERPDFGEDTPKEERRAPGDWYGRSLDRREEAAKQTRACPSCEHEVSKQAQACPACGHPIRKKGESGLEMMIKWCVVIGVVVVGLVLMVGGGSEGTSGSGSSSRTIDATITRIGDTTLLIQTRNPSEVAGRTITIHLNGSPTSRSTYRTTVGWPDGERSITIPLAEFSRISDGRRYDPISYRPTEVWIGGGGYSHQQYSFGR